MSTEVEVVHFSPGRVRLLLPEGRGNPEALEAVAGRIRAMPGVLEVRCRAVTGSILVLHELSDEALMFGAMMAGLTPRPPELPTLENLAARLRGVEQQLAGGAGARQLLFALFTLVGVIQLMRGNLLMPAATAFWYALELARETR